MILDFCAKTDTGRIRNANQDFCGYHVADKYDIAFFAVADGMGGHNAGEIASAVAITTFIDAAKDFFDVDSTEGLERFMVHTVRKSNVIIWRRALQNPEMKGMGTTFVVAAVTEREVMFANVGDSRAYVLSDGQLTQVTKDHSYVQVLLDQGLVSKDEITNHPRKNEITRALGAAETVDVDIFTREYKKGNYIILCSDGLSNMVSEEEMVKIILEEKSVHTATDKLIESANSAGGKDNITVVLIKL